MKHENKLKAFIKRSSEPLLHGSTPQNQQQVSVSCNYPSYLVHYMFDMTLFIFYIGLSHGNLNILAPISKQSAPNSDYRGI